MIKWGIIGVGDVCEIKSGPALQNAEGSELVAVMRRTGYLAEDFAKRHGVPKWYDKAEDLINDAEINAVYIATPPDGHAPYAKMVAEAGKTVYVEKPMARSHEECLTMVEACEKAGVKLFVAYYRRALPNFLKIKELIDSNTIGDIRFIDIKVHKSLKPDIVGQSENLDNWRTKPDVAGAGYFYDLASHQLDYFDFLFGHVVKANGIAKNFGGLYSAEDTTLGTFEFENGVLGMGSWCFATDVDSELEKTTIYGSKGRIEFSFFTGSDVFLFQENAKVEKFSFEMPKHIQQPLIQGMVDELNGLNNRCPSTGISGARTNKVLEEICVRVDK
ncbi:Gfo/Idh/MocA family protein [Jiulongibacter sediminis]|uniref:Oxidoreductase n=1 Tax=Jiulongibacter sediminis TaxID=1605367 RepID=A0A0P7BW07_9BACT|nr:Gfo/Idh/MocA family oxidoreductase [Jiulongibacter sediminis]KPM49142.1 oxidoreductase [Jiulongibacter sediminis]TBX26197.1 oxidoreductase [Jiulongibacter sediminis]